MDKRYCHLIPQGISKIFTTMDGQEMPIYFDAVFKFLYGSGRPKISLNPKLPSKTSAMWAGQWHSSNIMLSKADPHAKVLASCPETSMNTLGMCMCP